MKISTRAAVLSLLIFPGAGLWNLGEKKRALVFMIPTTIALIILTKRIIDISQLAINDMLESLSFNFVALFLQVHEKIYQDPSIRTLLWFLLTALLLSAISSYFVGKQIETKMEKKK